MANRAIVVAAGLVALAGVGAIAFEEKLQSTRPAVSAQTLSSELDARLRETVTAVHTRVDTLAGISSLHDSVSTDATTVRDQTQRERMFRPLPGEIITIAQVLKSGETNVLLVLPDGAPPAEQLDHDGARLALDKGALVLTEVATVMPSEPERAAELKGALAISSPVDLRSVTERLDTFAATLRIVIDGQELEVGSTKAGRRDVTMQLALSGELGSRLRVIASVPSLPSGPPFRLIGMGLVGFAVALLGLGLRGVRPGKPQHEPDSMLVPTMASRPNASGSTIVEGSIIDSTYEVIGVLGRGGMGTVWEARHLRLPDKRVAIKLLTIEGQTAEHLARFRREAEVTSRLGHPNIVGVLDFNTLPSGAPYIVLELLGGESLADRIHRGTFGLHDMLEVVKQIGSALHAAHKAGVVHRDLKPDNIFLVPTENGEPLVKVLDFGISKMRGGVTVQTQDATVFGTPQYMSPEQANGKNSEVDARTDVWALGAIVYEMLTGAPAFQGETMTTLLVNVLVNPSPSLQSRPDLPDYVSAAIDRALAKDAAQRWPDMPSFVAALVGSPPPSVEG